MPADELQLTAHQVAGLLVAVLGQALRGHDVVAGQMRVFALQAKHGKQVLQLVALEARMEQARHLQRVETVGPKPVHRQLGGIAQHLVLHNLVVERGIMTQQHGPFGKTGKGVQCLGMGRMGMLRVGLDKRIDHIAQHRGQLAGSLDEKIELAYHLACPHTDGSQLHHIVVEDVETGGLGIENHDIALLPGTDKRRQTRLVVVEKEVGRRDGQLHQRPHKLSAGTVGAVDFQSGEQRRPRYEVMLHRHHTQVGQQQAHAGTGEEVGSRNLEVRQLAQRTAHLVGIAVESHHHSHRLAGTLLVDAPHLAGHHVGLVDVVVGLHQHQCAGRLRRLVAGRREQCGVDAQLLLAKGIEHLQQIARRTVIDEEIMESAGSATLLQL